MTNVNWQPQDLEWIGQVHQLLLDLARTALSDRPELPQSLAQKSLTLAQKSQGVVDRATGQEREWIEQMRQMLLELARLSLSDRPKLPDDISQKAISLAQKAQKLKDISHNAADEADLGEEMDDLVHTPDTLLNLLRESLRYQQSHSKNPKAAEWQQLFNLLDVAQGIYQKMCG